MLNTTVDLIGGIYKSVLVKGIAEENLIAEIHYLYTVLGEIPTSGQMNDRGKYSDKPYYNKFGSWSNAIGQAGYPSPSSESDVPVISLFNEIHRLKNQYDGIPTAEDMKEHGVYDPEKYLKIFINWEHAIQKSDVRTDGRRNKRVPVKDLIAEIGRLYRKNNRVPVIDDMEEDGRFSITPYRNSFSSWNKAIKIAGFEPKKPASISDGELIAELQRINHEIYDELISSHMSEYGKYSTTTYIDRFGSWEQAVQAADITISESGK